MARIMAKDYDSWAIGRSIAQWAMRATIDDIDHGLQWYDNVHGQCQEIADLSGLSLRQVVGIVAALSPGSQIQRNLEDASIVIFKDPYAYVGAYGRRNQDKARKILFGVDPETGERWEPMCQDCEKSLAVTADCPLCVLGGSKVRAFYLSILTSGKAAITVIDRHILRAFFGLSMSEEEAIKYGNTPAKYRVLSAIFGAVANAMQVSEAVLQATIWHTIINALNENGERNYARSVPLS